MENKNIDKKLKSSTRSSGKHPEAGEPYSPPPAGQPASGPGYNPYPYRKLYRSNNDKWIAGVCGGIAENYQLDPTLVRLLWIVVMIFSFGIGIIAYILFWIFVDKYPTYTLSSTEITTSYSGMVHYHYHGRVSN